MKDFFYPDGRPSFLDKTWRRLPAWLRKSILEFIEIVAVSIIAYYITVFGNLNTEWSAGIVILLKALMKVVRSHPDIPVSDYVNEQ